MKPEDQTAWVILTDYSAEFYTSEIDARDNLRRIAKLYRVRLMNWQEMS